VSPTWSAHVFPHQEITKRVAQLDESTMASVATGVHDVTKVL